MDLHRGWTEDGGGGTFVPGLNTRNVFTTVELREGQTLVAKNSAPVNHNVHWIGHPVYNPGGNQIVPKGKSLSIACVI